MKNKRWLCYQMIITKQEINITEMDTIIRNISAKNKEEALGKFILNTSKIKAIKKLDLNCIKLTDLIKID